MGFKLGIWDFITFATIFVLVVGCVALVVFLMGCRAELPSPASTQMPKRSI
jgi:hypothetical protein